MKIERVQDFLLSMVLPLFTLGVAILLACHMSPPDKRVMDGESSMIAAVILACLSVGSFVGGGVCEDRINNRNKKKRLA